MPIKAFKNYFCQLLWCVRASIVGISSISLANCGKNLHSAAANKSSFLVKNTSTECAKIILSVLACMCLFRATRRLVRALWVSFKMDMRCVRFSCSFNESDLSFLRPQKTGLKHSMQIAYVSINLTLNGLDNVTGKKTITFVVNSHIIYIGYK